MARPQQPMPDGLRRAPAEAGVAEDYVERPSYPRNDYLAWIGRARCPEMRERRITRLLDELHRGGACMGMRHRPSAK